MVSGRPCPCWRATTGTSGFWAAGSAPARPGSSATAAAGRTAFLIRTVRPPSANTGAGDVNEARRRRLAPAQPGHGGEPEPEDAVVGGQRQAAQRQGEPARMRPAAEHRRRDGAVEPDQTRRTDSGRDAGALSSGAGVEASMISGQGILSRQSPPILDQRISPYAHNRHRHRARPRLARAAGRGGYHRSPSRTPTSTTSARPSPTACSR